LVGRAHVEAAAVCAHTVFVVVHIALC
jgi:hypothetical protein